MSHFAVESWFPLAAGSSRLPEAMFTMMLAQISRLGMFPGSGGVRQVLWESSNHHLLQVWMSHMTHLLHITGAQAAKEHWQKFFSNLFLHFSFFVKASK